LIRRFTELSIKENFITDVIVMNDYKGFIAGTQFGNLNVWKWGSDEKKLVHQFSGHHKTITAVVPHSTKKNLFITSSLDCSIKVWCMDVRSKII
jgi:WD40 repeat protein